MRATAQALDPRQVITSTNYTITLEEVDVLSAVEPPGNICDLWTPDTGYVDWAELGVKVNSQTPVAEACTLTNSSGSVSAATGAALTQCGTNAETNDLFFQQQPLNVTFSVSSPNDVVTVGLAVDNIESISQSAGGKMKQDLTSSDFTSAGRALSLSGSIVNLTGVPFVGGITGLVGGVSSFIGSMTSPSSSSPGFSTATSCVGGLMGDPVQSATVSPGGFVNDGPPSDTMAFTLTPAMLEQLVDASANTAGTPGCTPGICNAIDFYPTMTGLGPPAGACYNIGGTGTEDTIGDQGFPNGGPAFDYGCSSKLHVRLTVTRDWSTGPASFAKSPDMAAAQTTNLIDVAAANPKDSLISTYAGASGVNGTLFFNGLIPAMAPAYGGVNTEFTVPTTVSRTTDSVDTFYISSGQLYAATSGPGTDYQWQVTSPATAPDFGGVTAAARSPSNLDVFWVNPDGNVYDSYWTSVWGWSSSPVNVSSGTCYGPTGAAVQDGAPCVGSAVMLGGIAAVALNPWNLNVFYVGTDGGIWDAWWAGSSWNTYEIFGPSSPWQESGGVAQPGASIAAVAQTSTRIDVFYIGSDGGLWTSTWQNGGGWYSFEVPNSAGWGNPGTPISAVSRQPGSIDLVFEGSSNHASSIVWGSWQYPATSWVLQPIAATAGQTPNQHGKDAISIVAPTAFNLQMFYQNTQGNVATLAWQDSAQCSTIAVPGCDYTPSQIPWPTTVTQLVDSP